MKEEINECNKTTNVRAPVSLRQWRVAYFSICFLETLVSMASVSRTQRQLSAETVAAPSTTDINIIPGADATAPAQELSTNDQMLLQSRLSKLKSSTRKFGCGVAFIKLMVMAILYPIVFKQDETKGVIDFFYSVTHDMLATTLGLTVAIALILFYSAKRMMRKQIFVKEYSSCDVIGSTTVICTDKTGKITSNQMYVTKAWIGLDLIKDDSFCVINPQVLELLCQGVALSTSGNTPGSSAIENAIVLWATCLGSDMDKVKQEFDVLEVEAFNCEKKRSGVSARKKEDDTAHVHWKGGAEMVLEMCSNYYQKDGVRKSIDPEEKIQFETIIEGMAASGLTCIAFAHKQRPQDDTNYGSLTEEGLTLLGIVGIKDPSRPGAKEAIQMCKSAGVQVVMITGDNVFSAKAIATECGILEPSEYVCEGEVIEGEEFRSYSDEERMEKVDSIKVMARSSPSDKLLMVQCLKKKGHVVAITGHATGDAPALKEANIGISMGIQATGVAKESSDVVILDDNFACIVKVVLWGRCVYGNIRRFVQFQLSWNITALIFSFITDTSVQLLWINVLICTLGALALATPKPTKEFMHKPPVTRRAPLITNVMWRNLLAQSVYQIAVGFTLEFWGRSIINVNEKVKNAVLFNTLLLCQVFNLFNSRKLEKKNVFEGLHTNGMFIGIIGVIIIIQVVMVEFLNKVVDAEKLNMEHWGLCIFVASLSCLVGCFVKLMPVPERPYLSYACSIE